MLLKNYLQSWDSKVLLPEIAKAANVNISMISYYFGSKEKLYEKLVEYRMSEGQFFSKDMKELISTNGKKLRKL
jgi:AcrR family transcriptional regulator